jgi:hypothetical protein
VPAARVAGCCTRPRAGRPPSPPAASATQLRVRRLPSWPRQARGAAPPPSDEPSGSSLSLVSSPSRPSLSVVAARLVRAAQRSRWPPFCNSPGAQPRASLPRWRGGRPRSANCAPIARSRQGWAATPLPEAGQFHAGRSNRSSSLNSCRATTRFRHRPLPRRQDASQEQRAASSLRSDSVDPRSVRV